MTATPENRLEETLVRAVTEPSARPEFYRLLFGSQLFVIGQVRRPEGETPTDGGQLMLGTMTYQERDYHMVFSSLARLRAFAEEEVPYVALMGHPLFENTQGAHFVLNPGCEIGKELLAEEIASLLKQFADRPYGMEKKRPVLVGQPEVYPQALVDALKTLFAQHPDIAAAHLIQIAFQDEKEPPHPLIGVEGKGEWPVLAQEIGRVLKEVSPDYVVDVVPIDRANLSDVGRALVEAPPFYTRETKAKLP